MATKRKYGSVPVQDYSSFKTPEAQQAALNSQKKILDSVRTSTGAFANQADAIRKAGYTLNDTMDTVYSPSGGTIAGINKNNQLFSGSRDLSNIITGNLNSNPYEDRVANTYNVLDRVYDLDEMSKYGEERINRAFDAGRGVKFANNPNPADPFRVTSSQPTFLEVLGDIGRGLGGGTAEQTIPDLSIANQPRYQRGIIGGLFDTLPSLRMIKEAFGSAGNNIQGGIQKLNDYTRPQMIQPRDGFQGQIDRGSNLLKGLLGAPNYDPQASNSGVMRLPSINNNNIIPNNIMLAGLTDEQKMLLDKRRNMYPGILGIQEMLNNLPKGDPNDPATFEDVETYLTT